MARAKRTALKEQRRPPTAPVFERAEEISVPDLPTDHVPLGWERTEHGFLVRSPESQLRGAARLIEKLGKDGIVSREEAAVLDYAVAMALHYREIVLPRLDGVYAAIGAGRPRVAINRLLGRPDKLATRGKSYNASAVADDYRRLVIGGAGTTTTPEPDVGAPLDPRDGPRRIYLRRQCGLPLAPCLGHRRSGARPACPECGGSVDARLAPTDAVTAVAHLHGFASHTACLRFLARVRKSLPRSQWFPLPGTPPPC